MKQEKEDGIRKAREAKVFHGVRAVEGIYTRKRLISFPKYRRNEMEERSEWWKKFDGREAAGRDETNLFFFFPRFLQLFLYF